MGLKHAIKLAVIGVSAAAVYQELKKPPEERTWHGKVGGFVPYDFRVPTMQRIKDAYWNPEDPSVFTEKVVGVGWAVGILLGLIFLRISPILAGVIAGAAGGLGIGLAWRRMEASVSPRQMLTLMVIWALALGMGRFLGPLFFLMGGLGGWLSGLLLRQVRPALTRRQLAIIALGWLGSWLFGGLLFVLATIAFKGPLAALLIIIAMLLAGMIGGGVMFIQYRETYC